ncbi:MAG: RIP metalloprotease RseP [Verrucomicrobia bacterium]|nr:MAG: RIP metalloprotease RseP [Verrucomicrobiota bacterium]
MERILEYAYVAVVVVLLFGATIFVHELGHFLVALWRRMRVEAFAIGFGPKIWSATRKGIEYSIRWIPAGGFVRLPQMVTSEALEGGSRSGEPIPPAPPSSKILVAIAGPAMNVAFAFLVATVIYFVGLPVLVNPSLVGRVDPDSEEAKLGIREGDRIVEVSGKPVKSWEEINTITALAPSNVFHVVIEREGQRLAFDLRARTNEVVGLKYLNLEPLEHPVAGMVEADMPAAKAGLQPGDEFVSVNGVPVLGREHLIELVSRHEGQPIEVVVKRDGRLVTLTMAPKYDPERKRARIGVMFAGGVYEVIRPGPTPWEQVKGVWDRTVAVLGALIRSKETGVKAKDLSGPVGILSAMAVKAKTDFRLLLDFLVLLNINLAILNLLPVPVLDGGHVVMAILEKIRGRPLSLRAIEVTNTVFAACLLAFMLYVTFFDVRRVPLFKAMFDNVSQTEQVIRPASADTNAPADPTP